MILQTVQPVSVLESLQKDSIVFSLPDYSEYQEDDMPWTFKTSYEWMKKQMLARGVLPQNNETDLFWAWGWAGDLGKRQVDLRTRPYCRNQANVLLTIEKKPEDILLSDFSLWHFVLNYWALYTSKKEEKIWDNICKDKSTNYYDNKPLSQPELKDSLEKTWELIFALEEKEDGFYFNIDKKIQKYLEVYNKPQVVQATFWNINRDELKKVQYIKQKAP
jgi:Domain of unknown function (DUF3841)